MFLIFRFHILNSWLIQFFYEIEKFENLLLSELYDIAITSTPIDTLEISSIPFVKEKLLLSVTKTSILANRKEIYLCYTSQPIDIIAFCIREIHFHKQQDFSAKLEDKISLTLYNDYFVFSPKIRNS